MVDVAGENQCYNGRRHRLDWLVGDQDPPASLPSEAGRPFANAVEKIARQQ